VDKKITAWHAGDRLLTVTEVAAAMRVSNMTVYRLIRAGDLPAIRVGKNYRVLESDLAGYLAERAVQVEQLLTDPRGEGR
jgi:excisionase family DNA binding protein